ncbi:PAS domain-containing protein [bacterium]|nr:PAS domain-containing protein [bacterium]
MTYKNRSNKKNPTDRLPPLLIIGAVAILFPIFLFTTLQNIRRQQENSERLLLEKGAALIRSFEAGTRVGMRGKGWGSGNLQRLLSETAKQQDIAYLVVTDDTGTIMAHSDLQQTGTVFDRELDFQQVSSSPALRWRIIKRDAQRVFEVYKQFVPSDNRGGYGFGRMMFGRGRHFEREGEMTKEPNPQAIFIGLKMDSLDEAGRADIQNMVLTGLILFLAGSAGIVLLFLFQNYRSAQSSLSQVRAFSDNLVKNIPIGLIALDSQKRISAINQVAEDILEISAESSTGKQAADIIPSDLQKRFDDIIAENRVVEEEIDCRVQSGKTIPLEISGSVIEEKDRGQIGYVLLLKDLREVRALRKEIARSQRLASLGKLAGGIAHEIRNPLSSIKGFATYFKERYRDVPQDQRTADIMINEVERLDRVVGQLLELARPVKIVTQQTNVGRFIEDSLKLIEQKAKDKKIQTRADIPPEIREMNLDRDKINQVLLNLYLNALESMENGGRLTVKLADSKNKNQLEISVSDTGSGISAENLPRIFDPYFTTRSTGTGLGLAIVHNIIEAHNGTITATSQPGEGSDFTLVLPDTKKEKTDGE